MQALGGKGWPLWPGQPQHTAPARLWNVTDQIQDTAEAGGPG